MGGRVARRMVVDGTWALDVWNKCSDSRSQSLLEYSGRSLCHYPFMG